jgi:hypothetical protein
VKTLDCALFALAFAFVVAVIVPPAFAQVLGPIPQSFVSASTAATGTNDPCCARHDGFAVRLFDPSQCAGVATGSATVAGRY